MVRYGIFARRIDRQKLWDVIRSNFRDKAFAAHDLSPYIEGFNVPAHLRVMCGDGLLIPVGKDEYGKKQYMIREYLADLPYGRAIRKKT